MGQVTDGFYLGLDMGTSSLGWAATNSLYELLKAKGKDLWGVRTFEEAQTAVDRRTNRVSRRRRSREKARIGILREFFSEEINSIDSGFFLRCEESKYYMEDRSEQNKQEYALFADTGFTDKEYFKKYPTIFHLRKELLESKEPHDVRLVYLALLNMFKHRGHFLNAGLENISELGSVTETFMQIGVMMRNLNMKFSEEINISEIDKILNVQSGSRTSKLEKLLECLKISKSQNKKEVEVYKLICGMSGKVSVLFGESIADDEILKKSFSFRDADYETLIYDIEKELSDDEIDLIEKSKEIHDICLLGKIRKGYQYLSQARVADYEKHRADLDKLQKLVKEYIPEEYSAFFRKMEKDNYSSYVGSVNSGKEKVRRSGAVAKRDDFYKNVKKLLTKIPDNENNQDVQEILKDIDEENFLPKQLTASNGVIPNQLHLAELQKILKNASMYLPFLTQKDEKGIAIVEKIVMLFKFQIPYYVGPLNNHHKNNGGTAWVVRKEAGRVLPWNFDDKIDCNASRKEFIERMIRHCTYLNEERVLPKNALLYERFMVLNELNNLRIHGEKPSEKIKQEIFQNLFMMGKKVSGKKLTDYLIANGLLQPEEREAISGIDKDFHSSLSSLGKFSGVLGERAKEWDMQKKLEDIIFWGTVYSNDKKVVRECIEEKYTDVFTEEELKRILGFKFRDWGNLSKEFLELKGVSKETGEVCSLIQALWNGNDNLMELLSDKYTYLEELESRIQDSEKTLAEFTFEDLEEYNLSAPVVRMVWQTLLVLKDIQKVVKKEPEKIFVEMARGGGKQGERKASRKKKFEELYKKCKSEERDWIKEIGNIDESRFRSKKLYLYYLQKGRCMYSGDRIELSELFNDNKYDIDHIYPRHFVKDDNIDNNLVLVKKEINAHKTDAFPLESSIREKQMVWWKTLHATGFINDEKLQRLTRTREFSNEDLAGFISRQLVETHQGTKVVTRILKEVFPDADIVFPKGSNTSEFRKKFDLLKVRNVNDFHHAQDAYLNIVVGNAYDMKFTRIPMNYVKDFKRDERKYAYNMDKIFERTIERNGITAWIASEKSGKMGTIATVRKVMAKNTPLLTRMNFEKHGGLSDQTISNAKQTKNKVYLPMKTSDPRLADVTKYGGNKNISIAYFMLVEHGKLEKRIRTIEPVPIYLKAYVEANKENLKKYCCEYLNLVEPDVRICKIKIQSLVKRNGFYLHVSGKSGVRLAVRNAVPLCLKQKWISYIKELNRFVEKELAEEDKINLTKEQNIELFHILMKKHVEGIYQKKPNSISKKMQEWKEKFENASLDEQVEALLEILKITECANLEMDAKKLGFKSAVMFIGNNVTNAEEFKLINQSPSGLFESVIDLKTV